MPGGVIGPEVSGVLIQGHSIELRISSRSHSHHYTQRPDVGRNDTVSTGNNTTKPSTHPRVRLELSLSRSFLIVLFERYILHRIMDRPAQASDSWDFNEPTG